jgi:hypothetical protein
VNTCSSGVVAHLTLLLKLACKDNLGDRPMLVEATFLLLRKNSSKFVLFWVEIMTQNVELCNYSISPMFNTKRFKLAHI